VKGQHRVRATLVGLVRDAATKKPLAFADASVRGTSAKAKTNDKGEFCIVGLPSQLVKVEVSRAGLRTEIRDCKLIEGMETPIEVALSGDATLTGTVADAQTESPAADVGISVGTAGGQTKTDKGGKFRLDGVRSEPADIVVTAEGYPPLKLKPDLVSEKPNEVLVQLTGDLSASGQVVHLLTSKSVEGAVVLIVGSKLSAKTDTEGRFQFNKQRRREIMVSISSDGFRSRKASYKVMANAPEQWKIPLGGEAVGGGEVLDEVTAEPLANVDVKVANTLAAIRTDTKEAFRLEDMFGGPVELEV
jgi:hypothetical protein